MTIRTLIEVSADTHWDYKQQLQETLDKLGYEPKADAEHTRFMNDLMHALRERDLDPVKIVEEAREKWYAARAA